MKKLVLSSIALLTLAACAVQPATHADLPATVQATAPADWSVETPKAAADPLAWWQQFNDPLMHELVASVLDENLDLQAALERVKQAQAITTQRRSVLLPQLDVNAGASDSRQNTPPPLGYVRQAGIGLALSWTPDVFGGERLELLASQAQLVGRQHAADQVRLALAANTAGAYIDLRWAQAELKILQDNQAIRERALRLTQRRLQYGLSTQLDVARAQNQLSDLLSRIPRTQATIQHQLSLIAVYSGRSPEALDRLMLADAGTTPRIPVPAGGAPQMLPSEALLRRPDVLAAYATVQQRAAEVGVARAERYPKFSLRLTDGLLASSYLGLPTLTDNLFSAALNATSPIFNAGRITAEIGQNESRMRESELGLRQTMLEALKDVEDTRSDLVSTTESSARLNDALAASGQSLTLSTQLYKGGAASFLDVLDAQQTYLRDADALNQSQRDHALAAVALYRALGGGWSVTGDDSTIQTASSTTEKAK
ncbi:efflux transporter outer membrane subunit [Caballeronia sp. LZ035]|uniref:efflux transporter outer membrane subunit n=1 Tax=Caballeronia sp. LZ035 TaxID=3038568 RepID=UPI0028644342|nr:efflux transporter outer membrane subunit [Caballeronia sp. LZ035]MDR5762141.1 efflux transporter outer membrane subunit [Caballeronia sp. LZ035]